MTVALGRTRSASPVGSRVSPRVLARDAPPIFLAHAIHRRPAVWTHSPSAAASYDRAIEMWVTCIAAAQHQAAAWRAAAIASAVLMLALSGSFAQGVSTQGIVAIHVVELRDAVVPRTARARLRGL
jgi:hypothetical protein